jgi:hypothetical protein
VSNDGIDWRLHDVAKSQTAKRHAKTASGSQTIGDYSMALIEEHTKKGNLRDE